MKVYSISKWAFYAICLLIILLPVSLHWRLLVNGERAEGRVTRYVSRAREIGKDRVVFDRVSEIRFSVHGQEYSTYGPKNLEYKTGRVYRVAYDPADPEVNQVVSFSGFYLCDYSVLPLILLILWAAFYLSFNRYSKIRRSKEPGPGVTGFKNNQKSKKSLTW
jgi:hypothetical protein